MKLDTETRRLCSRIAQERCRPTVSQTAAELRRDTLRVLASGTPANEVQGWLRGLLVDALAKQVGRGA